MPQPHEMSYANN